MGVRTKQAGRMAVTAAAAAVFAATIGAVGSAGIAASAEMKGHAHKQQPMAGKLVVERAWARASVARNGAAYVTIRNDGKAMDKLVAVSTPVAAKAELHTHLMDKGIMRMRPIEAVEVHPGAPAVMQPGGNHIMLMGLKHKLRKGETFPLTLRFARSGQVTVTVQVMSVGARGMEHGGDHKGDMKKKHTH